MISLRRLKELNPQARQRMKQAALDELEETLPEHPRLAPVLMPEQHDVVFTDAQLREYLDRAIDASPDSGEALWRALRAVLEGDAT